MKIPAAGLKTASWPDEMLSPHHFINIAFSPLAVTGRTIFTL